MINQQLLVKAAKLLDFGKSIVTQRECLYQKS